MRSPTLPCIPRSRVLSGMRPTGALHLGHYHGALKNWVRLQATHECFFFVADWHALTTHYQDRGGIERSVYDMVIDWLAAGLDPDQATIFLQSRLPEHAELFTLLAMGTPLAWLERTPSYKDQIQKLSDRDLTTYGFLGYPLLQAADILIYKAAWVPVGQDQAPHVEMTREIARRFNHLYGRDGHTSDQIEKILQRMSVTDAQTVMSARTQFQENGNQEAWIQADRCIQACDALTQHERESLTAFLRGTGRTILVEPQALLTDASKLPGLDGDKMSKSYGNTIAMREDPAVAERKIKTMPTDPQRVRRSDPGDPQRCPVWQFHKIYSSAPTQEWVVHGCTTAAIGCIDCKRPVIEAVQAELGVWRERAQPYLNNPKQVHWIMEVGTERARAVARETMNEVRDAMGLNY